MHATVAVKELQTFATVQNVLMWNNEWKEWTFFLQKKKGKEKKIKKNLDFNEA